MYDFMDPLFTVRTLKGHQIVVGVVFILVCVSVSLSLVYIFLHSTVYIHSSDVLNSLPQI